MQAPILEQLSEEISEDELKIVKIDVDENPETAQKFGIMSIPTLLFKKMVRLLSKLQVYIQKNKLKLSLQSLAN